MVEITHKKTTLRTAKATAVVSVSNEETIKTLLEKKVPKGDVFEMAKTAGLFGVKKTADLIPDCHPMPIEYTKIEYEIQGLDIHVFVEVKTVYRTGVEVEAMHGASIVALTMYDMLKPIDKAIEIKNIRLIEKHGGKSEFIKLENYKTIEAAVIVCSDSINAGGKEDRSGKIIVEKLQQYGVKTSVYRIIPDEREVIIDSLRKLTNEECPVIIFTGGTGLSMRDVTPEAIVPELDRRIPGIEEAIRSYGQERTPYSMLSRSVAGVKGKSLIIALPGSTRGVEESMDAIFPEVMHIFKIFKGTRHD